MIPLFDIPEIVQHYAPHFAEVFSEEAFLQFQRYVSGLIVSENKTVEGINRLFVLDTRNQSSLNRLLTKSPFSVEALNQARLEMLARLPGTQCKPRGVLSIDDTLLKHYGKHFDQIALLYDPTEQRYVWAHNLVNLHYSDDQTDYPVDFRLWQPADLARIEAGLRAAACRCAKASWRSSKMTPRSGGSTWWGSGDASRTDRRSSVSTRAS
ncbi:MAG: transposase [Rhodothermales bacterium]